MSVITSPRTSFRSSHAQGSVVIKDMVTLSASPLFSMIRRHCLLSWGPEGGFGSSDISKSHNSLPLHYEMHQMRTESLGELPMGCSGHFYSILGSF